MKRLVFWGLSAACLLAAQPAALAQDKFPSRPVKIVVAFGPGSATDVTARILAEHMRQFLGGQSVIVENKPGAFGIIAIEEMARARPDGHTVMIGNVSTSALTPRLYRKRFTINPDKDFVALTRVSVIPGFQLISPKHLPVNTLAEFIAYAKARPGQIRYSTTGVGAFTHYEAEVFSRRAGIEMVHVPVKDGPPAMVRDILSGDVHIASMTMSTAAGLVASGQLKPLVTSSEQRIPEYPNVPTMTESGFPRVGTPNWSMMFVNAQTPRPIQEALFNAATQALKTDALKAAYQKTLTYSTPSASIEEAQSWLKVEMDRWAQITEEVKIEIDP
jgi:tripartite-type tricarboxylate transporter receptor subunit TctC